MYYDGSGNIDRTIAFEYLLKGIGEYDVDENSMLGLQGYKKVVVKLGYRNPDNTIKIFDNIDENNKSYGMIDVGFYTDCYWEPIEIFEEFKNKWYGKPMSDKQKEDLETKIQKCKQLNLSMNDLSYKDKINFMNKNIFRSKGKSMWFGFKITITDTGCFVKEK